MKTIIKVVFKKKISIILLENFLKSYKPIRYISLLIIYEHVLCAIFNELISGNLMPKMFFTIFFFFTETASFFKIITVTEKANNLTALSSRCPSVTICFINDLS